MLLLRICDLRWIHTLEMSWCNQETITDAAFVHLLRDCDQITDAAFVRLRGIHSLYIHDCFQITDAAFVPLVPLRGIHVLNMAGSKQVTITDTAFVNLGGIQELNMKAGTRRSSRRRPLLTTFPGLTLLSPLSVAVMSVSQPLNTSVTTIMSDS